MQVIDPNARGWRQTYFNAQTIPFWGVHVAAIVGVAALGFSWLGVGLALAFYVVRMVFVTAGYHRYFSHRSFRTSRAFQFVLAVATMASAQKGVLWWAAYHRHHHRHSDEPRDVHSPRHGFWWSHLGWILSPDQQAPDLTTVKDLSRYPELRWLERAWFLPPVVLGLATWAVGGAFALVWTFLVAQVLIWHGSFSVNSLSHMIGTRRFETRDDSRNHWLVALITCGEGWHNNHHHRPGAARQGVRWWEIDLTYYVLRALAVVGLVWDVNGPRTRAREPEREARVA
jgi:stearoyl-CoA desaturase (Delta-9 desaturase)